MKVEERVSSDLVRAVAVHPLGQSSHYSFEQARMYEHVGLFCSTAVNTMLAREAAIIGHRLFFRAIEVGG